MASPSLLSYEAGRSIGGKVEGVNKGLDTITSALIKRLTESRSDAEEIKKKALDSLVENNPALAYSILGEQAAKKYGISKPKEADTSSDLPTTKTTTKVGNTVTEREKPKQIDLTHLTELHSKYATDMEVANTYAKMAHQPEIPIKQFGQWATERGYDKLLKGQTTSTQAANKPEPGKDQIVMKTPEGQYVLVHKSREAEAKKLGFTNTD